MRPGNSGRNRDSFPMNRIAIALLIIPFVTLAGCDRSAEARSNHAGSVPVAAAPVIDSSLPSGEALRRFQSALPRVSALSGGARSRDELVNRFVAAVESGDSAALDRLAVSKAEYAFLYFPGSLYTRKPYELPPDIAWLLSDQNSRKGFIRLARRLGGKPLNFRSYECTDAETEAENRFWRTCQVSYVDATSGLEVKKRLFGAIIERSGSYKFLSYANDF